MTWVDIQWRLHLMNILRSCGVTLVSWTSNWHSSNRGCCGHALLGVTRARDARGVQETRSARQVPGHMRAWSCLGALGTGGSTDVPQQIGATLDQVVKSLLNTWVVKVDKCCVNTARAWGWGYRRRLTMAGHVGLGNSNWPSCSRLSTTIENAEDLGLKFLLLLLLKQTIFLKKLCAWCRFTVPN